MLEITEEATAVLERAYDAAARFNPDARVRIHTDGDRVQTAFADAAEPGDAVIEHQGLTIFVEAGITGTLDVSGQHDHLVVR